MVVDVHVVYTTQHQTSSVCPNSRYPNDNGQSDSKEYGNNDGSSVVAVMVMVAKVVVVY